MRTNFRPTLDGMETLCQLLGQGTGLGGHTRLPIPWKAWVSIPDRKHAWRVFEVLLQSKPRSEKYR
jgi:hypothetical protein